MFRQTVQILRVLVVLFPWHFPSYIAVRSSCHMTNNNADNSITFTLKIEAVCSYEMLVST
jgi:hypothetical protein